MARPAVDTEGDGIATTVQVLSDLGLHVGAGEGNRTLMTSLEGWGSAIELRPHVPVEGCVRHRVSIDSVPVSRHRGRTARAGLGRAECQGFVLRLRAGPRRVIVVMHAMWRTAGPGQWEGRLRFGSTGCGAAWLARLLWEQEAAGSNPAIPTKAQVTKHVVGCQDGFQDRLTVICLTVELNGQPMV
jgi:hypothetical protein